VRNPGGGADFSEGAGAELTAINADEPLLCGAEDERLLGAPAVRVAGDVILLAGLVQQAAALFEA
jgi:hypothetical protein